MDVRELEAAVTTAAASADEPANILVVDDLPEKLLLLDAVLESLGQRLVFARSGAAALREVQRREFAVVLLDVQMPGMDGLETARRIRQQPNGLHTPIIFLTAHADATQMARGYALGAVDFVTSPVLPEVLRSKVRVFVDLLAMQRRARRQADERVAGAAAERSRRIAEENTRRAAFLGHCGAALNASLDADAGMRTLLGQIVPRFSERAMVVLDGDRGGPRHALASHHADGAVVLRPLALDLAPAPLRDAIERGLTQDCPGECPAEAGAPHDPGSVVLPLRAGGPVLGVLVVARSPQFDAALLGELADRASAAFENVRLVRDLRAEIAERRQAEQRLRDSHRRKDEFLAMLSHELRNPLAPMRTATELIRRLAAGDARLGWAVDVCDRQVGQMTRLVEELLDVARIGQGKITLQARAVDLREAIACAVETARPQIDARGHRLVLRLPEVPVWLRGDATRLAQVFGNLLVNAAKYTPAAGRIELTLEAALGEGWAVVRVVDDGIGIDAALLPDVFELFRQGERALDRSQGGLGVGLTLVRRLVELHHGRVEARSAGPGQGSEFRVLLPCLRDVGPLRDATPPPLPQHAAAPRARILVVDDNDDAAQTVAAYLRLAGHEVRTARDGAEALASAPLLAPQVALLDVGLPGIDGYELARRLRALEATATTLLIALTGYGQPEDAQRAAEAGFDEHFVKPADLDALTRCIEGWLRTHAQPVVSRARGSR